MSDLVSQSDVLNLNPSASDKRGKNNSSNKADKFSNCSKSENVQNSGSNSENEGFLDSLLKSIDQGNESSFDHVSSAKSCPKNPVKPEFSEGEKLAVFESSLLVEILSLLDKLKIGSGDIRLGSLSTSLSSLVKTETNLNSLKNANNLAELLDIAKNLGLQVKNVKIERLAQVLEGSFPNLNQTGFFKTPVDNAPKELVYNKIAQAVSKNFDKNTQTLKQKEDTASLLTKTLKNLDFIIKDDAKNKNQKDGNEILGLKNNSKTLKAEEFRGENPKSSALGNLNGTLREDSKNVISNGISKDEMNRDKDLKHSKETKKESDVRENKVQNKTSEINQKAQNVPLKNEEQKIIKSENSPKEGPKEQSKETAILSSLPREETKKESDVRENKVQNKTSEINQKAQNVPLKNEEQKIIKSENSPKEGPKEQSKETAILSSLPREETKKESDVREGSKGSKENFREKEAKVNFDLKANNFESLNRTSLSKESSILNDVFGRELTLENREDSSLNQGNRGSSDELNSLVRDLGKTSQNQIKNPINTRETLQYFSQDLKEALEQYKAPITRLNITLHPSNLGEVEVTLVQRGSNLHISFNSNTHAMNLFIQNQAEFKNSLVNMGFTGLEMNFGDQNKREQNSGQNKNKSGLREDLDNKDEPKTSLELVLARYF